MRNLFQGKKKFKKIIILFIISYVIYIFINQQKLLYSYKTTQNYYQEQIQVQLAYQESLYEAKQNINSEEYIENVAREKLDMYLPNERVYVDKGK